MCRSRRCERRCRGIWRQQVKKLQREAERLRTSVELREGNRPYRVEGEVGRFGFALYEACDPVGDVVCRGEAFFPKCQPREWHKTEGFREEALCLEASKRSYRDNAAHLNRYRRQVQGGTPVTTLQDNAQKEGARVLDFLERHSQGVLETHGFEGQGQPSEAVVAEATMGTDRRLKAAVVQEQLTAVVQEMDKRGFSPAQISAARDRAAGAVYEDPAQCVNVSVDDVEVKKQKAHRERSATAAAEKADSGAAFVPDPVASGAASEAGKKSRPKVAHTVARIEQGAKHFTLSASSLEQVLRFVLAFLLHNDLLGVATSSVHRGLSQSAKHPPPLLCLASTGVVGVGRVITWLRNSKRTSAALVALVSSVTGIWVAWCASCGTGW